MNGRKFLASVLLGLLLMLPGVSAANEEETVQIAFGGDVLIGGRSMTYLIDSRGADYPFREIAPYLKEADLSVVNLECAVGTSGEAQDKEWTFQGRPSALTGLVNAGIDLVTLANNHILDYGRQAMLETLDNLDQYGIRHVGAGPDLDSARAPEIVEIKGIKFAFIGTSRVVPSGWAASAGSPGVFSAWNQGAVLEAIRKVDPEVDYTVVLIHWGVERSDAPEDWQVEFAKKMRDAGADVIIGHHPHVLQGIEMFERGVTAYSLGNFVFTSRPENPKNQETGILTLRFSKEKLLEANFRPAYINYGVTEMASGERKTAQLKRFNGLLVPFGLAVDSSLRLATPVFRDVPLHWAESAILKAYSEGMINGFPDGTFRPDDPVTLGQFLKILLARSGLPPAEGQSPGTHWAQAYLDGALAAGLLDFSDLDAGIGLDSGLPRALMAKLLARAAGLTPGPSATGFSDGDLIPAAYRPYVSSCVREGLLSGYSDGTFGPQKMLTRAEAVAVILRLTPGENS